MPEICPIFKWGDLDGAKLREKWKMLIKNVLEEKLVSSFNRKCKQEL